MRSSPLHSALLLACASLSALSAAQGEWEYVVSGETTDLSQSGRFLPYWDGTQSQVYDSLTGMSHHADPRVALGIADNDAGLYQDMGTAEVFVRAEDAVYRPLKNPTGNTVYSARMATSNGDLVFHDVDGLTFYRSDQYGNVSASFTSPTTFSNFLVAADGSGVGFGNDNRTYLLNGDVWSQLSVPTDLGYFQPTGLAVSSNKYVLGSFESGNVGLAKLVGAEYQYIDFGSEYKSSVWRTGGTTDNGDLVLVSAGETRLFDKDGNFVDRYFSPDGQEFSGIYEVVVGNAFAYTTFTDFGGFDNPTTYRLGMPQAVPEPASIAALGFGLAAVARRRKK